MFGISAFAEAPFAALDKLVVAAALTGVSASGNVGTVDRIAETFKCVVRTDWNCNRSGVDINNVIGSQCGY